MKAEITVRELIGRLGEGPVLLLGGVAWRVEGVRQRTDATDGTLRVQLRLARNDAQSAALIRRVVEVELNDKVEWVASSAPAGTRRANTTAEGANADDGSCAAGDPEN